MEGFTLRVALFSLLFMCINASVIGIDFGYDTIKVGTIGQRSSISIVLNEIGGRKIPNMIAFTDEGRKFGAVAKNILYQRPENVYLSFKEEICEYGGDLLTKKSIGVPVERLGDCQLFTYPVESYKDYNNMDLLSMMLKHIVELAEEQSNKKITDCVISLPPFFKPGQKEFIIKAAEAAGLKVLSTISSIAAVSLNYGMKNSGKFNETSLVVFYDMGASSTSIGLVRYNEKNKNKDQLVEVIYTDSIKHVNGNAFTGRIYKHVVDTLVAKFGENFVSTIPARKLEIIKREAEKAKIRLSVNREAHITIESLLPEGDDFRMGIDIETFRRLSSDLASDAVIPLERMIKAMNISAGDIKSFTILGGSTRIPAIKEIIENISGKPVDRGVNADEAVALGSTFYAAMLRSSFRVAGIQLKEALQGEYQFIHNNSAVNNEAELRTLHAQNSPLPSRKKLNLFNYKLETPTELDIYYVDNIGHEVSHFRKYVVESVLKLSTELNCTSSPKPRTMCRFSLGVGGILKLDSAVFTCEVEESDNGTSNHRVVREAVPFTEEAISFSISKKRIASIKKKLAKAQENDKSIEYRHFVMNALETSIYMTRQLLEEGEEEMQFASDEQRESLSAVVSEASDWFDENQDRATASEFTALKDKISDLVDPIRYRHQESKLRDQAFAEAFKFLNSSRFIVKGMKNLSTDETRLEWDELELLLNITEEHLNRSVIEQAALKPYEDPVISTMQIQSKLGPIQDKIMKMINKPPPVKPKKEPKWVRKEAIDDSNKTGVEFNTFNDIPEDITTANRTENATVPEQDLAAAEEEKKTKIDEN